MPKFSGDFELHLTLAVTDRDLTAIADELGAKYTSIELDRGLTPLQPMLTRSAKGTLPEMRALAARLTTLLDAQGVQVVRTKIEAAPWTDGLPESDVEADPDLYWEHHIKLLLPPASDVDALTTVVSLHGARLSRNARRTRADGVLERFVTQRCHGVGRSTARARLDGLLAALTHHKIAEVEEEYVVLDDRIGLDAGWLS
ncbi:hypothetical protein [Actinorhabdospora filicis]|uniref:hypothetical protein n=1 Tax=Actinorhabdospora filicis TaxID=1785913 RepID=UPI00255389E7|nr:hypothetical protein [Actinorhabdospora filicis]